MSKVPTEIDSITENMDGKGTEMIGYEEYLSKHSNVSKKRSEELRKGEYLLRKDGIALMPLNSVSWHEVVGVDPERLLCDCNVFHTRKACPHVAALLGKREDNGGKLPVTDARQYVKECLEELERTASKKPEYLRGYVETFTSKVGFLIVDLSWKDRQHLLLELARILNAPEWMKLFSDTSRQCFSELKWMSRAETGKLFDTLFEKRQEYKWSVIAMLLISMEGYLSKEKREILIREVAADEALTDKVMPMLSTFDYHYFSRERQVRFIRKADLSKIPGMYVSEVLHLMMEEPPLYADYLALVDRASLETGEVQPEDVKKLKEAGYGDRMQGAVDHLVYRINSMEDYNKVIACIPHETFLPAWKKRNETRRFRIFRSDDYQIIIDFLEDPEVNLDRYNVESLSPDVLDRIVEVRPENAKEICAATRKNYRASIKAGIPEKVRKNVMILAKGNDAIASKYVSDTDVFNRNGDDLVYLTAIGMHFKTLQKIAPELKKMEEPHAAGQNR